MKWPICNNGSCTRQATRYGAMFNGAPLLACDKCWDGGSLAEAWSSLGASPTKDIQRYADAEWRLFLNRHNKDLTFAEYTGFDDDEADEWRRTWLSKGDTI